MSISQIYSQFDADAHRVFRAAMALRPGAVLGVAHLVHGLISVPCVLRHPELVSPASKLLELGFFLSSAPINEGVPVANSPKLRIVLQKAQCLGLGQDNRRLKMICPSCLTMAVLEEDGTIPASEVQRAYLDLGMTPLPSNTVQPAVKDVATDSKGIFAAVDAWIAANQERRR